MTGDNVVIVGLPSEGLSALARALGFPHSDASPATPLPESKALLIYRTPSHFLEHRIGEADSVPATQDELEDLAKEALASWRTYHRWMLSLYRKREAACMLINGDRSIDFEALPTLIEARFGLRPNVDPKASAGGSQRMLSSRASVFRHVSDALAPDCTGLYVEMESCAELMGREPEFDANVASPRDIALGMLQSAIAHASTERELTKAKAEKMRDLVALGETLKQQRREIERHLEHIRSLRGDLDQKTQQEVERVTREIEELRANEQRHLERIRELEGQVASSTVALDQLREQALASAREVDALKQENQLSLLQLHQIQEELEHYFKLNQKNERRISELEQQIRGRPAAQVVRGIAWLPRAISGKVGLGKKIAKIKASGLFDEQWYVQRYPDVSESRCDPIEHYLRFGAPEGRNPSARFDTQWYLEAYPDVAKAKINPLLHYVRFGKKEGRKPQRFAT